MKDKPRNLAASVRQRLMNRARAENEDFHLVLTRYTLERLLYRLSQSAYANTFVLKGAILFQLWFGQSHRPTRDLDLLGKGDPSPERFEQIFLELCQVKVEEDGLTFIAESIKVEPIKEDEEYQGIRLRGHARLGNAQIPLQIDIGFGDVVTPGPIQVDYPTLLDFPSPQLWAYPRETVIAEKYQAMVMLGIANSRMKDFYDLWTLAQQYSFEGPSLCQAIQATFSRRKTELPTKAPLALTSEFWEDAGKRNQWKAFIKRGKLTRDNLDLKEIIMVLESFLMPPTLALIANTKFDQNWFKEGPWHRENPSKPVKQ